MIIDHTANAGFGTGLYDIVCDAFDKVIDLLDDDVHIDPVHIDRVPGLDQLPTYVTPLGKSGFAVTGCQMRVDVLPPGTDPDRPAAFVTICEENLSAEQARIVAGLLMVAAEYMEFLTPGKAAGNG